MFQCVVFSQDHGVEKPHPAIFQIALEELECSRDELLHVGDSLENDVAGAACTGIKSVWLNRHRISNETGTTPDHEISSLSELVDLVP